MAVRFILGRAGSGKTYHCLSAIQRELEFEPRRGPKLILLVPEQAGLQSERALLNTPRLTGAQRAEVLSFRRFAQRLLQTRPAGEVQVLSPVGRAMVLQRLVGEHLDELRYFRSSRMLPGLYAQLAEQVEEFITAGVTTEQLQQFAEGTGSVKLADLRLLYASYRRFLQSGYADPAMTIELARRQIAESALVAGARMWIDGFAGFSEQEELFLIELAAHADRVEVSLLIDPWLDGVCNDEQPDPYSLFAPTVQTYCKLLSGFRTHGVDVLSPLCLPTAEAPPAGSTRFDDSSDLRALEESLFNLRREVEPGANRIRSTDGSDKPSTANITLFEARDPQEETHYVVGEILRLTRRADHPLRYRDIAIITRQLGDEATLIAEELQRNHIPFFLDRRPPLSEHPLFHFLQALLAVAVDAMSTEALRQLLACDFHGLSRRDADELENYILAYRISGASAWARADWHRDPFFRSPFDEQKPHADAEAILLRINRARQTLRASLNPWNPTGPFDRIESAPGVSWAQRLFRVLENMDAATKVERWAAEADADGDAVAAARHRQAWRGVVELLDDFVMALGRAEMPQSEFCRVIQAGLAQLDFGLAPPAVDQVVVSAVERSRQPEVVVAFVMGFNDGQYPLARREQQLLNDDDRALLVDRGLPIEPPRSARLGDERLLGYIALTRARRQLIITYSRTGLSGAGREPSFYLKDVSAVLPDLIEQRRKGDSTEDQLAAILNAGELVGAMAAYLRETEGRAVWNTVYDRARQREEMRPALRRALASLVYDNQAALSANADDQADGSNLRTSITRLEQYAACPFQYFAAATLELKPRCTGELDAIQLGSLYHAVLDRFMQGGLKEERRLADLTDDEIDSRLRACIHDFNQKYAEDLTGDEGGQSFLWERLHHELYTALRVHRTIQRAGPCRTIATELSFGLNRADGLPAFELSTPAGRRVLLRGKINRIDTAEHDGRLLGFVFDYKRSRQRTLSLGEVYHGLSLQLIVYLLGLEAVGRKLTGQPVTPVGAFYLPLIPDFQRVDRPDDDTDYALKSFRPRGVFEFGALAALDSDLKTGSSSVIAAILNSEGELTRRTGNDAADADDFQRLVAHVRNKVGALCDDILDGLIPVRPYRMGMKMPCETCNYRSVCRFEFPEDRPRRLESMGRNEVFARLTSG